MSKRIWWIALVCFVMISLIGVQMSWAEAPQTFRGQKSKATKIHFREMEIEVPAGSDEATMTIENGAEDLSGIKKPKDFIMIGKPYRFGPHGKNFKKDKEPYIKIKLDQNIGVSSYLRQYIRLYYIDRDNKRVRLVPEVTLDVKNGILQGKLKHFSEYVPGIIAGWDEANLNPFTDFINNGEEHFKIGSEYPKLSDLTVVSSITSLPLRSHDFNLARRFVFRELSENESGDIGDYDLHRTGVDLLDPFVISDQWVWDFPHWSGSNLIVPGSWDSDGNINGWVLEPAKLILPGGQAYYPKNEIGQCQINGKTCTLYDEGGAVFAIDNTGVVYLSDGTRITKDSVIFRNGDWIKCYSQSFLVGYYLLPTYEDEELIEIPLDIRVTRVTALEDSTGRIINFSYEPKPLITKKNYKEVLANMPVLKKVEQKLSDGSYKTLMTHAIASDGTESFMDALGRTTSYRKTLTSFTINYNNGVKSEYVKNSTIWHKMYKPNQATPFRTSAYPSVRGDGIRYDDGIIKEKYFYLKHYRDPISVAYKIETYDAKTNKLLKVVTKDQYLTKLYAVPEVQGDKVLYDVVARPKTVTTQLVKADGTLGTGATYQYEYDNWGNITRLIDPYNTETRMAYYNTDSRKDLSAFAVGGVAYRNVLYPDLYNNGLGAADWIGTKLLTKAIIVKDSVHNTTKLSQTHYEYDRRGNLWTEAVYDEKSNGYFFTKFTYDQYGNVLSKTDPKGSKLSFEYRSDNGYNSVYLTRVYNPNLSGNQTIATFEYNLDLDRKKTATDPKGNIYRYEYDAIGRLTKEYLDNNSPTVGISRVIRYYDNDSHIELDFGGGVENRWEYGRIDYDPIVGKPKSIQRKNGNNWVAAKTIDYDSSGRLIAETDGEGHTTTHTYDALNRKIKTTRPDEWYTTFTWDDRKVTITDARGNTKTQYYDLLDRIFQVDEHPQAGVTYTTKYLYDTSSHLVQVINAKNANTNYTYDNLGRVLQMDYPQSGTSPLKPEIYSYDPVGNLITKTVNGKTKTFEYEFYAGYRFTNVTEPDNRTVVYKYDINDNVTDQIVSNGVNYHFDYDARNRIINSTATIDGRNFVFGYGYDLFGRTTSITYPNRTNPVTYQYDNLDRLQSIGDFVNSCSYDLDNKLTNMALANGMKNSFTYNNVDRPTNLSSSNTGSLVNLNYTYDAVGNIRKINGDCYDYDGMNRLIWAGNVTNQSAATSSFARGTAWAYDGAGNLTAKQTYADGQLQQSITLGYDLANRLWSAGSTTYANDEFGNRTQKVQGSDSFGYQYDGENRLSQVTKNGATILQNTYDGSGMRVKKMNNGKTTYFVYQGENPLLEYSSDDNQLTYYIYAGKKSVAEEKDGQKTFYHRDHLGSTRALTDQNGKLKGLCKYDAWGKLESTNEYDEGVINGDMELIDSVFLRAKQWVPKYDNPVGGNCRYVWGYGINGSNALAIDCNTQNGSGWSLSNLYVSPDTDYQLTGNYYAVNSNQRNIFAKLIYYAADGSIIRTDDTGALGSSGSGWKQFTLNSHAPNNATTMGIFLTQNDLGTTVYFDGIRLKVPNLQGKYDFTGKKEDDGTGLKYFGARFYDAEVGRFINQDPKKDGLNWFEYCNDNPLLYIDVTGMSSQVYYTSHFDYTVTQKDLTNPILYSLGKLVDMGMSVFSKGNVGNAYNLLSGARETPSLISDIKAAFSAQKSGEVNIINGWRPGVGDKISVDFTMTTNYNDKTGKCTSFTVNVSGIITTKSGQSISGHILTSTFTYQYSQIYEGVYAYVFMNEDGYWYWNEDDARRDFDNKHDGYVETETGTETESGTGAYQYMGFSEDDWC